MLRLLFITTFLVIAHATFAQRTVKVTATYTYYVPETMSLDEAKRVALDRAKIQAIADEFGTIVTQSSSTLIETKNGESDTQFFSRGGSNIKGEWIETLSAPDYRISSVDGTIIVEVTVKGKIRELQSTPITIVSKTLRNGKDDKFESTNFSSGDDLYLSFISPMNGFLNIYLIDYKSNDVYSVLPYKHDTGISQTIEKDKRYIFFSSDEAEKGKAHIVDEYTLTCKDETEYNELVVVFSQQMIMPLPMEIDEQTSLRHTNIDKFNSWLLEQREYKPNMQIIYKQIIIKK